MQIRVPSRPARSSGEKSGRLAPGWAVEEEGQEEGRGVPRGQSGQGRGGRAAGWPCPLALLALAGSPRPRLAGSCLLCVEFPQTADP